MNNPRITKKERGLIKGAIRRVFSRSDLRRSVVDDTRFDDTIVIRVIGNRPRVKKWSLCALCRQPTPSYLIEVDHKEPVIPVDTTLESMSWDELVDGIWCPKENLQGICKECHKLKSKLEMKQRRSKKNG